MNEEIEIEVTTNEQLTRANILRTVPDSVITVIFADHYTPDYKLDEINKLWSRPVMLWYCIFTAACIILHLEPISMQLAKICSLLRTVSL